MGVGFRVERAFARGAVATVLVGLAIVTTSPARADEAGAERLFNEAKRLVKLGRYAEACPKLEESDRLDHALGTQFNLADCYEHTQRLAMARALFARVAADARAAGKKDRERTAGERAAALEPKLARLTIVVANASSNAEVLRNEELVPRAAIGKEEFVDPGVVTIRARMSGRVDHVAEVSLVAGEARTVTIPELLPIARPAASPAPTAAPSPSDKLDWNTQRIAAVATGGAAAVALAVGAVFGFVSISKHDDASAICPEPNPCSDLGASQTWTDATSAGTSSTIGFVVGLVLVGAGATLWLTAPTSGPVKTGAQVDRNGILVRW